MSEDGFKELAQARVAIVGLGLMGGSLALALRGHCGELLGSDVNPGSMAWAATRGLVDQTVSFDAALAADVVILATPVRVILAQLADLAHRPPPTHPTLLLDLGSTKTEIVAAMAALPAGWHAIGGHPMCGKEVSGAQQAEAGLFRDKVFILSPLPGAAEGARRLAEAIVAAVGARPLFLPPDQHDLLAALASHLPYVVAALLVRVAEGAGDQTVWTMAASGFRDTSRLAASDLTMMVDILLTNRAAILGTLDAYGAELEALRVLIEAGDSVALQAFLKDAQHRRRHLFQ